MPDVLLEGRVELEPFEVTDLTGEGSLVRMDPDFVLNQLLFGGKCGMAQLANHLIFSIEQLHLAESCQVV